ncbi:hypothetical protein EYF80_062474 [Liparis tanakae]|uniref:Uncharacterized protein n=1 Tax=Liparis tanakae TaxID=230148 RepID=A0A4Z2EFA6_9TELE|nr:hypothetical protein EYF80_062474 [Liparis tanakae]
MFESGHRGGIETQMLLVASSSTRSGLSLFSNTSSSLKRLQTKRDATNGFGNTSKSSGEKRSDWLRAPRVSLSSAGAARPADAIAFRLLMNA